MCDTMKTITLRTLVREPLKVKRMTRAGRPVLVTDRGEPLWIVQAADSPMVAEARRRREIDELLDEVLRGPRSNISVSKILLESRR
jgi:antitoxin (DNA-binding transcriptional repressor) of toxin-antitoxin stability system